MKWCFFLMKWHFLKYKYRQIALYYIKIIVNVKIFEVRVSIHFNLQVYRRSSSKNITTINIVVLFLLYASHRKSWVRKESCENKSKFCISIWKLQNANFFSVLSLSFRHFLATTFASIRQKNIEFKLLGFYITRLSHSIMFYYIFACNLLGNIIEILLEALAVSLLFYWNHLLLTCYHEYGSIHLEPPIASFVEFPNVWEECCLIDFV